jgi:hypothetical protein
MEQGRKVMTEKNYVVNVKTTKGTIVTARGDSAEELISNVNALVAQGAADAIATLEQVLTGATPVPPSNSAIDTVVASLGGTVVSEEPIAAPPAFAPVPPPVSATPSGPETVTDPWGNQWTYGRPDAPSCPNGPMVLKRGINQAGKPYVGFFDPAGGPRWQGEKIDSKQQTKPVFGVKA